MISNTKKDIKITCHFWGSLFLLNFWPPNTSKLSRQIFLAESSNIQAWKFYSLKILDFVFTFQSLVAHCIKKSFPKEKQKTIN